jgi:hypothetical protein
MDSDKLLALLEKNDQKIDQIKALIEQQNQKINQIKALIERQEKQYESKQLIEGKDYHREVL